MRSSDYCNGVGEGPVAEDTESTWYFAHATQLMTLRGHLLATSTTLRSYRR